MFESRVKKGVKFGGCGIGAGVVGAEGWGERSVEAGRSVVCDGTSSAGMALEGSGGAEGCRDGGGGEGGVGWLG